MKNKPFIDFVGGMKKRLSFEIELYKKAIKICEWTDNSHDKVNIHSVSDYKEFSIEPRFNYPYRNGCFSVGNGSYVSTIKRRLIDE